MHKNLNLLREKQADQPINAKIKQKNKKPAQNPPLILSICDPPTFIPTERAPSIWPCLRAKFLRITWNYVNIKYFLISTESSQKQKLHTVCKQKLHGWRLLRLKLYSLGFQSINFSVIVSSRWLLSGKDFICPRTYLANEQGFLADKLNLQHTNRRGLISLSSEKAVKNQCQSHRLSKGTPHKCVYNSLEARYPHKITF